VEREAIAALAAVLGPLGIVWVVIGAVAANRYRRDVRLTGDVDLLVADHGPGLAALESALSAAGWSTRRGTPDGAILRLRHRSLGVADIVLAETDYQREAIERARAEPTGSAPNVRVLRIEDVLVHKLIAARPRDLADIEDILSGGLPVDDGFVERWAEYWDVLDLWRRLRETPRA
jgi:hypothetical protein